MLKPWHVLDSRVSFNDEWLTVRSDRCQTSSGQIVDPYHVIEYPPWVNMIVLTPENQIVLVRQYRHAAGKIMTEIPCGIVDESDASPGAAAIRELAEETGYEGDTARLIGSFNANPATQTNRVTSFLILNARKVSQQRLDPNEEIEVVLQDLAEFLRSVFSGVTELQGMHNSALLLALPHLLRRICDAEKIDIEGLINSILSISPGKLS